MFQLFIANLLTNFLRTNSSVPKTLAIRTSIGPNSCNSISLAENWTVKTQLLGSGRKTLIAIGFGEDSFHLKTCSYIVICSIGCKCWKVDFRGPTTCMCTPRVLGEGVKSPQTAKNWGHFSTFSAPKMWRNFRRKILVIF